MVWGVWEIRWCFAELPLGLLDDICFLEQFYCGGKPLHLAFAKSFFFSLQEQQL